MDVLHVASRCAHSDTTRDAPSVVLASMVEKLSGCCLCSGCDRTGRATHLEADVVVLSRSPIVTRCHTERASFATVK